MTHHFDIEEAQKHGVVPAVLLSNIRFWVEKNRANDKHFHDGTYWTYNSVKAFDELFPYLTSKQIRSALERLITDGALVVGNYNKFGADRTRWFSIANAQKGKSNLPNGHLQMPKKAKEDLPVWANGIAQTGTPIPDTNHPVNKPEIKQKRTLRGAEDSLSVLMPFPSDSFKTEWQRWKDYKKAQFRFTYKSSDSEVTALKKLNELAGGNEATAKAIIEQSIANGWNGLFEPKNGTPKPIISGAPQSAGITAENAQYAVMRAVPFGELERWGMEEYNRLKDVTEYKFIRFES